MSSSDLAPLIHTLFSGIGIQIDHLDISEDHNSVEIVLKTPDSPILIGIHGKNMDALRHVLSRMIERHRQKFLHVHIEVNDYMKAKDERLFRFLDKKVALLRATGGRVALPDLNAFERKKAHNYIAELKISGLTSVSEGEASKRVLYLVYTGNPVTSPTPSQTERLAGISEDGVGI